MCIISTAEATNRQTHIVFVAFNHGQLYKRRIYTHHKKRRLLDIIVGAPATAGDVIDPNCSSNWEAIIIDIYESNYRIIDAEVPVGIREDSGSLSLTSAKAMHLFQ